MGNRRQTSSQKCWYSRQRRKEIPLDAMTSSAPSILVRWCSHHAYPRASCARMVFMVSAPLSSRRNNLSLRTYSTTTLLNDDCASGSIDDDAASGADALCCSRHADDRRDAVLTSNDSPMCHCT